MGLGFAAAPAKGGITPRRRALFGDLELAQKAFQSSKSGLGFGRRGIAECHHPEQAPRYRDCLESLSVPQNGVPK